MFTFCFPLPEPVGFDVTVVGFCTGCAAQYSASAAAHSASVPVNVVPSGSVIVTVSAGGLSL